MGIICSKPQVEYYTDSYHITDTFANQDGWRRTVKELNHVCDTSFLYEHVNVSERFGDQPYAIYVVYHNIVKEAIQMAVYDHPTVAFCNCIFVFCARKNFRLLSDFPDFPTQHVHHSDPLTWSTRQTYIALGFVISACAEESIPTSLVNSFHSDTLRSILDLPSYLVPTALLTIGAPD